MRQLGNTIAEIAYQKAGILKPGILTISAPQHPDATAVIQRVAREVNAPLAHADERGIRDMKTYPVEPVSALRGEFQRENARLALSAVIGLNENGFSITPDAMRQGLATVQWPGRLEVASTAPLIVLDGAHNDDSARKLERALYAEFSFERLLLILGLSRDKQFETILEALVPHASTLILTRSRHPRAHADLDKIAAVARPMLHGDLLFTGDIPEALDQARTLAQPGDLICVTGSLFVVGAAREALGLATVCD
jgi:dihydrofolate synthase/folylpolyglutamate synthase